MNKNLWGEQEKSRRKWSEQEYAFTEQEKSLRKWSEQEYACTEQDDGIKI